ncbi:3-oxoacyl-ACP synthase III family protein [Prolixibacter sp. NT017]|uniref:3-oxoacyl-ACP synthase III family protein n=1 Tax=Prolixibacter sp. NT017 TaxID=2652390 RepID=UPI001280C324|nr:ketoacyl-ACP synthase III [Prolixibacter sp. NT017]GET26296.1 3-oxoacyl-[acyl-carrier-protein] synthase 3 [Prolixibacter sp. NT017]
MKMFLNTVSHYLPKERVPNGYFKEVNGLSDSWIFERTGIKTRSKAAKNENTNTMAVEAVKNALPSLPFDIRDVDLIVGASYSPYDTVATMGHVVQREFHIKDAQVVYISSACSSLVNALEVVEGYFAMGKSKQALVIASEHNTAFSDETCEKSGHLWGDGATALFISDEPLGDKPAEFLSIYSRGLGHISKGPEAVYLTPGRDGLQMPDGRDVFIQACQYMRIALEEASEQCGLSFDNLDWIVPHQANHRIIKNLAGQLSVNEDKIFTNIRELGNTGSASTGICLSQNMDTIQKDALLGITVFGGGYSAGAAILRF